MTGPRGNSEFCFPVTLNEVEGKQNSLFPEGQVIKCFVMSPNSKIEKKLRNNDFYERWSRRAVLQKRCHHDNSLSSQPIKVKTILELLCFLSMLNSRILGLIWRGKVLLYIIQLFSYLASSDSDQRASCRTQATHFWRQIKSLKISNVQISPLLLWYVFA